MRASKASDSVKSFEGRCALIASSAVVEFYGEDVRSLGGASMRGSAGEAVGEYFRNHEFLTPDNVKFPAVRNGITDRCRTPRGTHHRPGPFEIRPMSVVDLIDVLQRADTSMEQKHLQLGYHLVAFLDVLDQRERFRELRLPKTADETAEVAEVPQHGRPKAFAYQLAGGT